MGSGLIAFIVAQEDFYYPGRTQPYSMYALCGSHDIWKHTLFLLGDMFGQPACFPIAHRMQGMVALACGLPNVCAGHIVHSCTPMEQQ